MLDTALQQFVFYDKYSRFNHELGRRETWEETVDRVTNYLIELSENKLTQKDYEDIKQGILSGEVSPSMRLMATAGKAARRNPLLIYNCAYLPVVALECFSEVLWLSMSGVGVGYSVEYKYVDLLPEVVPPDTESAPLLHVIEDSAEGWVKAFNLGIYSWWSGARVEFDYSLIRPAGAPLLTKGGQASGPEPLILLMKEAERIISSAAGRKLRPIEVFDLMCVVGNCAVSGGVRRSAQITLFSAWDKEMLSAKSGSFWETHPFRTNANISAVWEEPLTKKEISDHFEAMFAGGAGEPGIVSRHAMNATRPRRRRELTHGGSNPCGEIFLHGATREGEFGGQLCNLTSVNVTASMNSKDIHHAAKVASTISTIQATATDFKLLRPSWKKICEEERLIGVSLIGVADNAHLRDPWQLHLFKSSVRDANERAAKMLGIAASPATTCIKPAGNSSVLYGTSRGMNARYAPYYIRRVRVGAKSPIRDVLEHSGVELLPEYGQEHLEEPATYVATFYDRSPEGAITTKDQTALEQLDLWLALKRNYTEHNPSVTIEYRASEEQQIIDWVQENQDHIGGLAFLPKDDTIYPLAPYEEITRECYEAAPEININWELLAVFEQQDSTAFELECAGGICDLR